MSRTLLVLGLSFLSGCSTVQDWMGSNEPSETRGLIQEVPDGPPLISSVDITALPEPEAKPEPLSRYGNPESYLVDDVTYKVKPVRLGFEETGIASWYGRKFHGRLTSSGESFDMFQFTAAHKTMPIPAWICALRLFTFYIPFFTARATQCEVKDYLSVFGGLAGPAPTGFLSQF